MTLTKAVEAARNVLEKLTAYIENGKWDEQYGYPRMIQEAFAALPQEPMTENEIIGVINPYLPSDDAALNTVTAQNIIRALKAANAECEKEKSEAIECAKLWMQKHKALNDIIKGQAASCACGDSFTDDAKCVNCLHVEALKAQDKVVEFLTKEQLKKRLPFMGKWNSYVVDYLIKICPNGLKIIDGGE